MRRNGSIEANYAKKIKHPLEMLKFLACNDRYTAFPNVYIALRIYLTIPVTVASGERSFSKLKLIKNYLRSNMIQDRLSSLAIISIESEISRNLKMDTIIKDFAEKKQERFILILDHSNMIQVT